MMKKKVILSSVLTIALCLCLIAGSTFALFTSESTVNVAVQAARVNVVAVAERVNLWSTLGTNVPETTATFSTTDNTVRVDKMVPGDVIEFDIVVTNNSNVTVDYRTVLSVEADRGLWGGLVITFTKSQNQPLTFGQDEYGRLVTNYSELAAGVAPEVVHVRIELPEAAGNEYQEKSCTFAYKVEAIQGNAQ